MNNLQISNGDQDGFIITDNETDKIYVYYSEIDLLIQELRKKKYEYNNIRGQHSVHSKNKSVNTPTTYKSFDKKEQYINYLQSDEWKQKRKRRLQFDAHRCVECGGKLNLEVHHKRYDTFGNEDVKKDLMTLCDKCHDKITAKTKRKRKVITECS